MLLIYGKRNCDQLFNRAQRFVEKNTRGCKNLSFEVSGQQYNMWALQGTQAWSSADSIVCVSTGTNLNSDNPAPDASVRSSFRLENDRLLISGNINGSVAHLDRATGVLNVGTDPSGMYPIFYFSAKDIFVASNNLAAVGFITNANSDMAGIRGFLRNASATSDRTPLVGIKRLRPGDSLHLNFTKKRIKISSTSRLWTQESDQMKSPQELVSQAWDQLNSAAELHVKNGTSTALMFSGGWDSRTLLATLRNILPEDKLRCYIHGDIESREVALASRIASASNIAMSIEPLNSNLLSYESLFDRYLKTGNVVFPHWHWAGQVLENLGVDVVFAGIYGEIFGGHYGPSFNLSGLRKIAGVAYELGLPLPSPTPAKINSEFLLDFFCDNENEVPWFIDPSIKENYLEARQVCNSDVKAQLSHMSNRGVPTDNRMIEAYLTEQRHAQYIGEQLLSIRPNARIATPFAAPRFLRFATQIPPSYKVHNRLNKLLLKSFAPDLLQYPMAATLVPARGSIFIQEASRAARKVYETTLRRGSKLAPALFRYPRLGWANFEFLRNDNSLMSLGNDLQSNIWNKRKIRKVLETAKHHGTNDGMHPLYDMMMKIVTIDMLLYVCSSQS